MQRPTPDELAPFYRRYVALVPDGELSAHLQRQAAITTARLSVVPAALAAHRYAPDKWTVTGVLGHLVDTERIMVYRALRFARGDATPLPGFDENQYAANSPHDRRPLDKVLEEFHRVRLATISFLDSVDDEAARRGGVANQNPFTVRGLAWVIAGHELHHLGVLRERYGVAV